MKQVKIIGISGPSGCGKSTIAKTILEKIGALAGMIISTDDLHKYERGNYMWDVVTHFNPQANNLDLGDLHLQDLKDRNGIWRSNYCHHHGMFLAPKFVSPRPFVINEGLHAFFTPKAKELTDVKIYIETPKDLLNHWKIIRDVNERGQCKQGVLKKIQEREKDVHHISSQRAHADFIITFFTEDAIQNVGDETEQVKVGYYINSKQGDEVMMDYVINQIKSWSN